MYIEKVVKVPEGEAEIWVTDGRFHVLCFDFPIETLRPMQTVMELEGLFCTDVFRAEEKVCSVKKLPEHYAYSMVGQVRSVKESLVQVGGLRIRLDAAIPGDISDGEYLTFTVARLDVVVSQRATLQWKARTLFDRIWDRLFNRSKELDPERAKELYFINFANHTTMRMNGEYEAYCRFHVPVEQERIWSEEVKEMLLEEILSGKDPLKVVNLSNVNLPEEEIMDAFRLLAASPKKDEILDAIEILKPLFEEDRYMKITALFE